MHKTRRAVAVVVLMLMVAGLAGCAKLQSGIHDLHGSIIGNEYYIRRNIFFLL